MIVHGQTNPVHPVQNIDMCIEDYTGRPHETM